MTEVLMGDIVSFTSGGTPRRSSKEFYQGDIPWITGADIDDQGVVSPRSWITEEAVRKSATNVVRAGSLVFVTRTSVGKVAKLTQATAISQDLTGIDPKPGVASNYIRHFLRSSSVRLARQARGATIKGITREVVASLTVPLPTLEEQERIAGILDQADAIRTKRRASLDLFDELLTSLFQSMSSLGVAEKLALSEVVEFYAGNSLPSGEKFEGQEGGALLAKVSDMNSPGNGTNLYSTVLWTDGHTPRASTVSPGAVVFPKRGASIGTNKKRLIVRTTCLDPNLMGVQPGDPRVVSQYLFHWFLAFDLASLVSGSSVPQLNKRDLARLQIDLPPVAVQQEFAARVEQINAQRALVERALEKDEELFASLQSRAFKGEL